MVFGSKVESTRLLGVVLTGFAVYAASSAFEDETPDRTAGVVSSAEVTREILATPRAEAPIGTIDGTAPAFRWSWDGTPSSAFEVVLLDETFAELWRSGSVDRTELPSCDARSMLTFVRPGLRYHWCVQLAGEPTRRSAPMPIRVR